MKNKFFTFVVSGIMIGATGLAQAQTIPQRQENQQDRIANGVANGSLTPHETQKLEQKEGKINREVRRDRRQNGGPLTRGEKAHIRHQQNKVSRDIYHEKHDSEHQ